MEFGGEINATASQPFIMAKRTGCGTATQQAKIQKKCGSFMMEWLSDYVRIEEEEVKLGEIFSFSSEKGLLCKTCCEAKIASEFLEGKCGLNGSWTTSSVTLSRKVI